MSKSKVFLPVLGLALFFLAQQSLFAEFVFLKDGKILEGEIIKDGAKEIVFLVKGQTENQTLPRAQIMRLLYTSLKMGKVYVQKRNGENVLAYIVDEDRESYTFRKNLYQPQEFSLKREEVLFIAEKNPSGLKMDGEAGTHTVRLEWLAPYGMVKKYQVYLRKNKTEEPALFASSLDKKTELSGLESHTRYFVLVKAVDEEESESLPSNEIEVVTANIAPLAPTGLEFIRDEEQSDAVIRLNSGVDPDGKVVLYRFSVLKDGQETALGETQTPELLLKDWRLYEDCELLVRAVDDLGGISQETLIKLRGNKNALRLSPAFMAPFGKLGDMAKPGFGLLFSAGRRQVFLPGLTAEAELGGFYLPGNTSTESVTTRFQNVLVIPLWITLRYELYHARPSFVLFSLSGGAAVGQISYDYRQDTDSEYEKKNKTFLDPSVKAGIWYEYRFDHTYSLFFGVEGGAFFEKDVFSFLLGQLGLEYRF